MSVATQPTLKERFLKVLVGFEQYGFTEQQLEEHQFDLETALHDLQACIQCDGARCKTYYGKLMKHRHDRENGKEATLERLSRMSREERAAVSEEGYPHPHESYWFGLSESGCRLYHRPHFSYHPCPGPEARKQELKWRFLHRRRDEIPGTDD